VDDEGDHSVKLMQHRRRDVSLIAIALLFAFAPSVASAALQSVSPLEGLQVQLTAASLHAPGRVGIAMEDLATGMTSGVNATASLPAASTIKIPVMVEVFRQMQLGRLDLGTEVGLESRDRDWGWGDMADAPAGTRRTVKDLLWLMITRSDNTATNMLIRKVGRQSINVTMAGLGLHATYLGDYIRSETDTIRYALRTSPHDMVALLDSIARDRLVDEWSSREMLAILTGQTHNGLLPEPLPRNVKIAHKTGSLHDTLNDVGIVYAEGEPYVIAVMTTELPDLDLGRSFIHKVSRLAYDGFSRFEGWRESAGLAAFAAPGYSDMASSDTGGSDPISPDEAMWDTNDRAPAASPQTAGAPDPEAP
jgi:beta-lactamase class A